MPPFRGRALLESLLVALLTALYLAPLRSELMILTFQSRDTARALEVLKGHLIFFGPEVTGGGHIPGGLYYYLIALPLALGLGWKGLWLLFLVFQGTAAGLLWYFFRVVLGGAKIASDAAGAGGVVPALFAVLCFVSSLPINLGIRFLLNSGFMFPFAVAFLACLCVAFSPQFRERVRRIALCLAFFTLSLGFQLHLSLTALIPPFLLLFFLGGRFGFARFRGKDAALAAIFLFPLFPYYFWRIAGDFGWHFGQQPPHFAGLKSLGTYLQSPYGNTTFLIFEANRTFGRWYAIQQLLLQLNEFVFDAGGFTIPVYFLILWWLARQVRLGRKAAPGETPSRVLFLCWVFAFIPGLIGAGAAGTGSRYAGISSLAHIFFASAALERLLSTVRVRVPKYSTAALLALAPVYLFFFGALSPRAERALAAIPGIATLPPAMELENLTRHVVAHTGWPYAIFRERAFLVNVFNEMTIQTNYEEALQGGSGGGGEDPDGYFVARRLNEKDFRDSASDLRAWLIAQRIPELLSEGLRDGGIRLGEATAFGATLLVPYRVADRYRYPEHFQNRSEHYENTQEARIAAALREPPGKTFAAVFDGCPGEDLGCRVALVARSPNPADPAATLFVEVLGLPISLPTMHVNPAWTESIHEPYVSYRCRKTSEVHTTTLAPVVGYDPGDSWILNHSFLAPYSRELALHCPDRVTELTLGFRYGTVTNQLGEKRIPGQEQRFPLER